MSGFDVYGLINPLIFKLYVMKKSVLILVLMMYFINTSSKAQTYFNFPESNAVWNAVGSNMFTQEEWHFRYAVFGDTVIDGVGYSKLYSMYDSTLLHPQSTYFAAIRENEDKQVFCLLPDFPEAMLYDFGLEPGDTMFYNIGGGLCYGDVMFWPQDHYRVVMEVDSMLLLNNTYRKSWVLSGSLGFQTWLEGIGSINWFGLLNPLISDIALCGDSYQFACFKQNETVLYLDNPFCDHCFCSLLTGIEQQSTESNNGILVFPNPAKGSFTVQIQTIPSSVNRLEIIDLTGRKHMVQLFTGNETSLSTDRMSQGIYIIRVVDASERVIGMSKIIIE